MEKKYKLMGTIFVVFACSLISCNKEETKQDDSNQYYLAKFLNYDGFPLYYTYVKSGESVNYKGPNPTRSNSDDDLKFYQFTGWDHSLDDIRSDTTFTATYREGNRYLATFVSGDDVLQTYRINEGTTPKYEGAEPFKDENEQGMYAFNGWSPTLSPITSDSTYTAQFEFITKDKYITILNDNNEQIHTNFDYPYEFYNLNDDPTTENNEIAEYLYKNGHKGGFSGAKGYEINWTCIKNDYKDFVIEVSSNSNLESIDYSFTITNSNIYTIYNLAPGTYYYRVKEASGLGWSEIKSFTFVDALRTIYTNNEVSNMRDIGGYKTSNNKHIKYGYIYRSAQLNNMSNNGYTEKLFKNVLGIKTELDVRFDSSSISYQNSIHPMDGVTYQRYGLTDAYPNMITSENTITDIKNIFDLLVTPNALPLDFHCTNGADRTGYLALLIEGALGITDEDIYRDYEMTSFTAQNNYYQPRCDVTVENDVYGFRSDGYRETTWQNGSFEQVILDMKEGYSSADASIADTVYNFLTIKCGVSVSTINQLRELLLED